MTPALWQTKNRGNFIAAVATDFHPLMFGNPVAQGRNIKRLASFEHRPAAQRTTAGVAVSRGAMRPGMIRPCGFLRSMPVMPLLPASPVFGLAQRFRLGLVQPVRRGRFAGVAAVKRKAAFEFGDLGRQRGYSRRKKFDLRKQRAKQAVFVAMAKPVKAGKFVHE